MLKLLLDKNPKKCKKKQKIQKKLKIKKKTKKVFFSSYDI